MLKFLVKIGSQNSTIVDSEQEMCRKKYVVRKKQKQKNKIKIIKRNYSEYLIFKT